MTESARRTRRKLDGVLLLDYTVTAASAVRTTAGPVPTDPGLVVEAGEQASPYQRTAAYAVVTSDRGVLLTELSALTSAPGRWTLPGGGLDPGAPEPVVRGGRARSGDVRGSGGGDAAGGAPGGVPAGAAGVAGGSDRFAQGGVASRLKLAFSSLSPHRLRSCATRSGFPRA